MFGVEWEQPIIVAAALAQAAVHKDTFHQVFIRSDDAASDPSAAPMPAMLDLFAEARASDKLKSYLGDADGPNTLNLITRGLDDVVKLTGKVRVGEEELEKRTAEMVHAALYVAACAAAAGGGQGGKKEPRYDFFLM